MELCNIDGKPCRIHANVPHPDILLVQPSARHETKGIDEEASLVEKLSGCAFALAAFDTGDWAEALMPWADEAVSKDERVGQGASATLDYIERSMLPWLDSRFAAEERRLPVVIGGYSLGGLFALWASGQSGAFNAVAAVSPSVWINGWTEYAATHQPLAKYVYTSLGDREEHCRNRRMSRIGDCIRHQHELLVSQVGAENTMLEWNEGNHFHEEPLRMARGFAWCMRNILR